jgi:hypothetical protein
MQLILTNRAIDDINKAKKWYNEQQANWVTNLLSIFLNRLKS